MATTVSKSELDQINQEQTSTATTTETEQTYEGKFIGTLVGNATTAKELEKPYNFSLSGDASGTVEVNASSVILPVTVNHSTHADTADFAGKTQLSARASVADMANTAEFAYRAGKFAKLFINLTGLITGTGSADNSNTLDIEVTNIDAKSMFVFGELAVKPDTSKIYVDVTGRHFWIYDDEKAEWVDCFLTLENELDEHKLRLTDLENINADNRLTSLEGRADALEDTKTDHEARITANEETLVQHDTRITTNANDITALTSRMVSVEEINTSQSTDIADHEKRISNMETSTDVGQFATRLQSIETKNTEQDASIKSNTDNIATNTQAISDLNTSLDTAKINLQGNIDALNTSVTKSLEETNTNVATNTKAIEDAKTELTQTITDNKSATDESIDNLKTSLASDYVTLASEQTITGAKTFETSPQIPTPTDESVNTTSINIEYAKNLILNSVYPVGSIYMSVNNVSPQTFIGGTWLALENRFLIGASSSYPVNSTGGATTHTLTVAEMPSHNHLLSVNSIGAHTHFFKCDFSSTRTSYTFSNLSATDQNYIHHSSENNLRMNVYGSSAGGTGISGSISTTGSSQAHSIMNPYLSVYMWKRIA